MKSESKIQQMIWQWFWNTYCLPSLDHREIMYHVPNEGQHKLTSIGVYAGIPDLIFTFRGVHYYCEIKTPQGKLRRSQKLCAEHITNVKGCKWLLVRSLEEFKEYIEGLNR
jgi:hypothetical protein